MARYSIDRDIWPGEAKLPPRRCHVVDATGVLIPFVVACDTETGAVWKWKTDAQGRLYPGPLQTGQPFKLWEQRPAPLAIVPYGAPAGAK